MSGPSHSTITQQPLLVQVDGSPNCQVTLQLNVCGLGLVYFPNLNLEDLNAEPHIV